MERKLGTCLETIERIGASGVTVITVLNKIDLIQDAEVQQKLKQFQDKSTTLVAISALCKTNLEQLKQEILTKLKSHVKAVFTIPVTNKTMQFMAWLFDNVEVQTTDYDEKSVRVVFEADAAFAERVRSRVEKEFNGKVERI